MLGGKKGQASGAGDIAACLLSRPNIEMAWVADPSTTWWGELWSWEEGVA